jgi:hypothetical protein
MAQLLNLFDQVNRSALGVFFMVLQGLTQAYVRRGASLIPFWMASSRVRAFPTG